MSIREIRPVKLSLNEGDFYTLWAPKWTEHGSEWQAFLGDDSGIFGFKSPEAMLDFLESGRPHDLTSHPKWNAFNSLAADRVVPASDDEIDVVGLPLALADRPSHVNVSTVARTFEVVRSFAEVADAKDAVLFFASHSVLGNVVRGADHYRGEHGPGEWSAVGRAVLSNWEKVVESMDEALVVIDEDKDLSDARERIATATADAERAREEEEKRRREEKEQQDPYDASPWGVAGIDPVKISIQGKTVYTLRTYLQGQPVFLGSYGTITAFQTPKQMLRWMVENDDHELAAASTWPDLVQLANAGELEVTVHPDNSYSFAGVAEDIAKGPSEVDTEQMGRAYELLADAADFARDDSLNSYFLANPRMQDYISYQLGATDASGYVPSKPYSEHAEGWKALEEMLIKRFSKF